MIGSTVFQRHSAVCSIVNLPKYQFGSWTIAQPDQKPHHQMFITTNNCHDHLEDIGTKLSCLLLPVASYRSVKNTVEVMIPLETFG